MLDADFYGKAAGILNLAAFVPYILALYGWGFRWGIRILLRLPERAKPNRASWFVWAFVGSVILPTYHYSGAQETIWVPVALVAGPIVVAVLSLRWGEGGWTRFDVCCLVGACISILGWVLAESAVVGLLLALVADACGVAATVRHAYRRPDEENRLAWTLFLAGDTLNLFAVQDWSWAAYATWILPIYMIGHVVPIVGLLWLKQTTSKGDVR